MVADTAQPLSLVLTASYFSISCQNEQMYEDFNFKDIWSKMGFGGLGSPLSLQALCQSVPHHFHDCFTPRVRDDVSAKTKSELSCLLNRGTEAGIRKSLK